jgi:hypothetical protein
VTGRPLNWFTTPHADPDGEHVAVNYIQLVGQLRTDLEDAGSAFTVAINYRELVERLDPTVTAAFELAIAVDPTAGEFLTDAWRKTYGLHPDLGAAYDDAVHAVEQLACPLVLQKAAAANKATLGTVNGELRQAAHNWKFVLVDKDDNDSIVPVLAAMERLWEGQVSRHAGGARNRRQTQEETQAAVHLAAFLVQMLGSGALARRTP